MIFRQLFDSVSGTYTYLIASRRGGEALIIDPVLDKVDRYLQLVRELDLRLVKALDTHLHADHITGLGALRDRTHCVTVMGEQTKADVVSIRVAEGDKVEVEGIALDALYTPGHTDNSYSYLMQDRVFTGDTLLIRGTGRTDFQNGDARAQDDSIFNKLLKLPTDTLVFPAHDYKGDDGLHNRRGKSVQSSPAGRVSRRVRRSDEQLEACRSKNDGCGGAGQHARRIGSGRHRASGMDVERRKGHAARRQVGGHLHRPARKQRALRARRDSELATRSLRRSDAERGRGWQARMSLPAPHQNGCCFTAPLASGPPWAVRAAHGAGLGAACHIKGGINAWKQAGGPLTR